MNRFRILEEIERTQWAITPEALNGIRRAVRIGLTEDDYPIFHGLDPQEKIKLVSTLGEQIPESKNSYVVGSTGVMFIDGPIVPRASIMTEASGLASIEGLTKDFKAFQADDEIKQIAFLMDSPGGAVTGISDFANLVRASGKPKYGFIVGQALSAMYWIASALDKIYSTDTGLAGSIGVVISHRKGDGDDDIETISSQSPLKRPDFETDEGRDSVQRVADDLADVFVSAVATNRNVSKETVESDFGQGAPVVAQRALSAGMIDGITTVESFFEIMNRIVSFDITTDPAIAGEINHKQEVINMTLKEMLASNPAIAAEFEKQIEVAKAEGFEAGKKHAQARADAATPFLRADSTYGEAGRNLALQVLAGKIDAVALQAVATVLDAQREQTAQAQAQDETEAVPLTPPLPPQGGSEDSETTFRASVDAERIRRGLKPRYEVQ